MSIILFLVGAVVGAIYATGGMPALNDLVHYAITGDFQESIIILQSTLVDATKTTMAGALVGGLAGLVAARLLKTIFGLGKSGGK